MFIKRGIMVQNTGYQVDVPEACPICHRYSEIAVWTADVVGPNKGVQVVLRCAYHECRSFFICSYGPTPSPTLLAVSPLKPPASMFPESVSRLSPTFVAIFKEAHEAKHLGLTQIAGPGYRKAFEFLIKDYAKSLTSGQEEEIEKMFAGRSVADFISDACIQAVAKRCLWLGNDESHYLRKWTEHDVEDLAILIKLTASWIDIDELSKSYVAGMPG